MVQVVASGPFVGSPIRTAKKAGKCADFRHCGNMINVGDLYVQGDCDPYEAGGFAHDRMCLSCGGIAAQSGTS